MKTKYIAIIAGAAVIALIAGCSKSTEKQARNEMDHDMMGMNSSGTVDPEMAALMGNAKPYTLDVCLNSGEALDSMGGPVTAVYQGQIFKFCCKDCLKEFNEDKDSFMTKLMATQVGESFEMEDMDHSDPGHTDAE